MQQQQTILNNTIEYVKQTLSADSSGHDWWHIYRVWQLTKYLAKQEQADIYICELAALLHDIADWKFHDGDLEAGPRAAEAWLSKQNTDKDVINAVCQIIREVSFKGANVKTIPTSLNAKVVQDADRLDAIGAIGIARTFAYGGHAGHAMYDPNLVPQLHDSFDKYKNSKSSTINHFHEKLLLLKDRMNTQTAKSMAAERHQVMENFLEQFMGEWEFSVE